MKRSLLVAVLLVFPFLYFLEDMGKFIDKGFIVA